MEVTASRPSHDQRGARVLVPSLPAPRVGNVVSSSAHERSRTEMENPVRAISMQSETGAAHGHSTSTPVSIKTNPGPLRTCRSVIVTKAGRGYRAWCGAERVWDPAPTGVAPRGLRHSVLTRLASSTLSRRIILAIPDPRMVSPRLLLAVRGARPWFQRQARPNATVQPSANGR